MALIWSDEFDSALSLAGDGSAGTWRTKGYEAGGSVATGYRDFAGLSWNVSPTQHPSQNPFSVAGSVLTIKAQRTPAGVTNVSGAQWMGGYLVTNHLNTTPLTWRFGYFEFRARCPNPVRGMFPALWLFNNVADRSNGKESAEIDLFEVFGESDGQPWAAGYHKRPTPGTGHNAGYFTDDTATWHRYGLEWTSTALRYYKDGILKAEITGVDAEWFQTADLGIRIDYVMDLSWEAEGSPLRSTTTDPPIGTEPRMEVDYVRVFDAKPSPFVTGSNDPLAGGGPSDPPLNGDAYSTGVLALSPWAYYRLNETSGSVMFDSSGNARHGTLDGEISYESDYLLAESDDTSMTFLGGYGVISGGSAGVANTTTWTLEAIFNTLNNPADHAGYLGSRTFGNGDCYVMHLSGTNKLEVRFTNSLGTQHTMEVAVTPSVRTHLHVVYDGSTLKTYINGVLGNLASGGTANASIAATGQITNAALPFNVGRVIDKYAITTMDEIAIYRIALSPAQITTQYTNGTNPPVGVGIYEANYEETYGGGGGGGTVFNAAAAFGGASSTSFTARYVPPASSGIIRSNIQARGEARVLFTARLADTTPPVISEYTVAGVRSDRAVVVWVTNEDTNRDIVGISLSAAGPFTETSFFGSNLGRVHYYRIGVGGLAGLDTPLLPGTTYYVRVQSRDNANNNTTSSVISFTTTLAPPRHRFFIDWSGDGDFLDSAEEVTSDVLFMEGVNASRGRDQIRQLSPPVAGDYNATLDNRDRDYSPANVQSPLVGLLEPGKLVRWEVDYGAVSYGPVVAADNPVHWWRFGETSGTAAVNSGSAGSATNGLYENGVTLGREGIDSAGNTSIATDGVNDWVSVVDHASLRMAVPFTLECWFQTTSWTSAAGVIRKDTETGTRSLWGLHLNKDSASLGKVSAQYYHDSLGSVWVDSVRRLNDGVWHHAVITITGSGPYTMSYYVDAELQGTTTFTPYQAPTGRLGMAAQPPTLGGGSPTSHAAIRLDEVALYSSALTLDRIQAHRSAGLTGKYAMWTGVLDDLPQHPTPGRPTVQTPALGTLSRLRGRRVTTSVYQNISTDVALGHLLDAAGWPALDRVLNTGSTILEWWWLDDQDAFSAMVALLSMEGPGATIYEDGRGYFVFEGRTYRLLQPRCKQVQAIFGDTGAEPFRSPELGYEPGLKDVVNACSVEVEVRALQALGVVWSLGQTVSLGNNETKGYTIRPNDPFQNAVTPVSGTDFTVSAGTVTSVTMTRTNGGTTAVFLTAGAGGATVTGLQLRAQLITVTNQVVMEESKTDAKTIASVTKRGVRHYPLPLLHTLNPEVARDFCNVVVQRYREPRPQVTITVPCVTDATTRACLARQISDRIAIQDSVTGLSLPAHIEQIRWQWRGGDLYAVFGCEQASTDDFALWGTAIWDTSLWAF